MSTFNLGFALGVAWTLHMLWRAGRAVFGQRVTPEAERVLREAAAS